jgi:hypothetical protein
MRAGNTGSEPRELHNACREAARRGPAISDPSAKSSMAGVPTRWTFRSIEQNIKSRLAEKYDDYPCVSIDISFGS